MHAGVRACEQKSWLNRSLFNPLLSHSGGYRRNNKLVGGKQEHYVLLRFWLSFDFPLLSREPEKICTYTISEVFLGCIFDVKANSKCV